MRDKLFREWYDARQGTKYEGFAYDVWCAAWEAARPQQKPCECVNPKLCDLHDACLKNSAMPLKMPPITMDEILGKDPKIINE